MLLPRTRLRPPMRRTSPRSFWYPDAAILSGQNRYSYDWAGFRAEIPAALVPARRPLADR